MAIPAYIQGYPQDGSSLGQSKTTIRNNLDGTFLTLGVDHINNNGLPGSQPAGYHTLIHQVTQTAVTTLANYNQVFSGIPGNVTVNGVATAEIPTGGDTQLYSLSSMGILNQLTGSLKNTPGYAWLGGILIQWGLVASSSTQSNPVIYPVEFPTAIFNIQVTPVRVAGVFTSDYSVAPGATKAGFTIINATGGATGLAFYWFAIGN